MGAAASVEAVSLSEALDAVMPKTPRGSPDVAKCDRTKVMEVINRAIRRPRERRHIAI